MHAFIGHLSAFDLLRQLDPKKLGKRWPTKPRMLPKGGDCVATQRSYVEFSQRPGAAILSLLEEPVDLLVPSQEMRSSGRHAKFHVWGRPLPAGAMHDLGGGVLLSTPEFALMQLCGSQSKLDPLLHAHGKAVREERAMRGELGLDDHFPVDNPLHWERMRRIISACVLACEFSGTYRLATGNSPVNYQARTLMRVSDLSAMSSAMGRTSGETRASTVAAFSFDDSGSPMETALALLLTLPVDYGGFGLPKPVLNVPVNVTAYRGSLSDRDVVKPDMLWGDAGVVVEYDSLEFHGRLGKAQLAEDAIRSNILTSLGYRCLRVTPQVVASVDRTALLASQIAHLLGVVLQVPNELQMLRRKRLFLELMR